jgi:ferredoxin-type protein NapH
VEREALNEVNDRRAGAEVSPGRTIEVLRPANSPADEPKIRKRLLLTGVSLTLFGLASSTKEFLGCMTLPIDGIFYLLGTTSHIALAFFLDIAKYFIMAGVFITVTTLIFFPPFKEEVKLNLHFRKWRTWKKRRLMFQFFVLSLILLHIGLVALGKTTLPSLCPLSFAELGNSGVFGVSAVFWGALFALVLVFGRALCGWACVYTPVQEQASNVLTAIGKKPQRKKLGKRWIIYVLTALFWTSFVVNVVRSAGALNFRWSNGFDVGTYWLFFSGLLTIFPITVLLTHKVGSRFFCKYLCPLGGTMSLYSKLGLLRMRLDKGKCTDCGACAKNCQMGVDIPKYALAGSRSIADGNCIVCGDCVDVCPKDAIAFGFGK